MNCEWIKLIEEIIGFDLHLYIEVPRSPGCLTGFDLQRAGRDFEKIKKAARSMHKRLEADAK